MKYIYIESNVGNGFEDAGADIADLQFFTDRSEAHAYCSKRFFEFTTMFLGAEDMIHNDMSEEELAEALNGDVTEGYWCCQPESITYGIVKEYEGVA